MGWVMTQCGGEGVASSSDAREAGPRLARVDVLQVPTNAPALTIPQRQVLLRSVRPRLIVDERRVLHIVADWQHRHHAASIYPRKLRLALHHALDEGSL